MARNGSWTVFRKRTVIRHQSGLVPIASRTLCVNSSIGNGFWMKQVVNGSHPDDAQLKVLCSIRPICELQGHVWGSG